MPFSKRLEPVFGALLGNGQPIRLERRDEFRLHQLYYFRTVGIAGVLSTVGIRKFLHLRQAEFGLVPKNPSSNDVGGR